MDAELLAEKELAKSFPEYDQHNELAIAGTNEEVLIGDTLDSQEEEVGGFDEEEFELGENPYFDEEEDVGEEFDPELEAKLWAEYASEEELAATPNFLETDEGVTEDMEDELWAELKLGEMDDEEVDEEEDALAQAEVTLGIALPGKH